MAVRTLPMLLLQRVCHASAPCLVMRPRHIDYGWCSGPVMRPRRVVMRLRHMIWLARKSVMHPCSKALCLKPDGEGDAVDNGAPERDFVRVLHLSPHDMPAG